MSFKLSSLIWLRGLDLKPQPLGYEFYNINFFIELAGVVGCHETACVVMRKLEESCVWVGFGLAHHCDPANFGHYSTFLVSANSGSPLAFTNCR